MENITFTYFKLSYNKNVIDSITEVSLIQNRPVVAIPCHVKETEAWLCEIFNTNL